MTESLQRRRLATVSPIDPSQSHLSIWNDLESPFIASTAIQQLRADLGIAPAGGWQSNSQSNAHSFRSQGQVAQNPNRLAIMPPNTRCFVCGNVEPNHSSRRCYSTTLVNGQDGILKGRERKDAEGNTLCFSFNGRAGCNPGANCDQRKH
ncbi:hypothetical protein B0H14DRAFT_3905864 [Mycena olivaceomarginata]|nr:hypothetical protein B0H14DRAFT_3905864 [Mycena olivaceomarginata]